MREALKLALAVIRDSQDYKMGRASTVEAAEDLQAAIKQALAAPVQEPVAWLVEFENGEQELHFDEQSAGETHTPLYATPPAAQRQWVSLTDQEAQWLYDNCRTPSNLIDMVEARLKEKNT